MEIEVNRIHRKWTFRYKAKVFSLLPIITGAMLMSKRVKSQFKGRYWRQSENNTDTRTQRRRTYTHRQKKMKETRLVHGLEKALPGENNEPSSKEFSRKMQLFFFLSAKKKEL